MTAMHGSGRRRSCSPSRSGFSPATVVMPRPPPASRLEALHVDATHAAAAVAQRLEVSGSLGADQPAEAERAVRDLQLVAGVIHDLDEHAGVGTSLVQLAGRVEVA